ncbi:DUF1534 domain-containing protein, partial [Pseudomonas edaphica]
MKIVPTLPRGNASCDALRHRCARLKSGRGASLAAFLCCAWERSSRSFRQVLPLVTALCHPAVAQPTTVPPQSTAQYP